MMDTDRAVDRRRMQIGIVASVFPLTSSELAGNSALRTLHAPPSADAADFYLDSVDPTPRRTLSVGFYCVSPRMSAHTPTATSIRLHRHHPNDPGGFGHDETTSPLTPQQTLRPPRDIAPRFGALKYAQSGVPQLFFSICFSRRFCHSRASSGRQIGFRANSIGTGQNLVVAWMRCHWGSIRGRLLPSRR